MSRADELVILTNPGTGASANPAFLNELSKAHVENTVELERAEVVLEHARITKLLRMTPERFAELSVSEKRNYLRWSAAFARRFNEIHNMIRRNTPADIDLPAFLRRT